MARVKNYDPALITMICGPKIITGYNDGEFVKASRNEQSFTLKVGVDGEGCRARNRNRSGKVVFTLLQSSSSNDDLSDFFLLDETSGGGVFPLLIKDADGTTLLEALTAWVQKPADISYGKEVGTREWTLETDELIVFVGGQSAAA